MAVANALCTQHMSFFCFLIMIDNNKSSLKTIFYACIAQIYQHHFANPMKLNWFRTLQICPSILALLRVSDICSEPVEKSRLWDRLVELGGKYLS